MASSASSMSAPPATSDLVSCHPSMPTDTSALQVSHLMQVVLIAGATALTAIAGTLAATGYVHLGKQDQAAGIPASRSVTAGARSSAIPTITPATISSVTPAAAGLETNPTLARQYAETRSGAAWRPPVAMRATAACSTAMSATAPLSLARWWSQRLLPDLPSSPGGPTALGGRAQQRSRRR